MVPIITTHISYLVSNYSMCNFLKKNYAVVIVIVKFYISLKTRLLSINLTSYLGSRLIKHTHIPMYKYTSNSLHTIRIHFFFCPDPC